MALQERALASGSQIAAAGLQYRRRPDIRAADYILVPGHRQTERQFRAATNIGGILGGFIGGGVGALVSSINISSKTADVVLTVTNVRTTSNKRWRKAMAPRPISASAVAAVGRVGRLWRRRHSHTTRTPT
jgi:hypothetical protein